MCIEFVIQEGEINNLAGIVSHILCTAVGICIYLEKYINFHPTLNKLQRRQFNILDTTSSFLTQANL